MAETASKGQRAAGLLLVLALLFWGAAAVLWILHPSIEIKKEIDPASLVQVGLTLYLAFIINTYITRSAAKAAATDKAIADALSEQVKKCISYVDRIEKAFEDCCAAGGGGDVPAQDLKVAFKKLGQNLVFLEDLAKDCGVYAGARDLLSIASSTRRDLWKAGTSSHPNPPTEAERMQFDSSEFALRRALVSFVVKINGP